MKTLKGMIGACFAFIVINLVLVFSGPGYDQSHVQRMVVFAIIMVPLILIYGISAAVKALIKRSPIFSD